VKKRLNETQLADYARDGYLIVRQLLSSAELDPLSRAYRADPSLGGSFYGMVDKAGAAHPINIWVELGDDMIGMIPRLARVVETVEQLLGEPCYHWHSKFTDKPPGCEARIDWHQDFTSWYDDGCLFPNMLTVGLAIEPATRANGCLQVVPGSHLMGLMDHQETGIFEMRLEAAQQRLGLAHCEMEMGDAVFFHCNTLHGSGSNPSENARLMMFSSYNSVFNEPVAGAQGNNEEGLFMGITPAERKVRPLHTLPDDVLLRQAYLSVFDHTPFKQPIETPGEGFTRAVRLEQ
jgi:hypothetical protein